MARNPVFRSKDAPVSRRIFLIRSGQVAGAAAFAGTASTILAACGSSDGNSGSVATKSGTLTVAVAGIPASPNPLVSTSGSPTYYTLVMERLFSYSQTNKPVPMLAISS